MYVRIYFVLSEELHCHILGLFVTGKQRAGPEKLILFLFVQVERMLCMRVHNLNSNDIIITDSHSRLVNHHFVLMIFNFFKEFGSYLFHGQARVKTKIGCYSAYYMVILFFGLKTSALSKNSIHSGLE
jgi:hypothetical protein